ncbi:uncharacterized protein FOMMEDRAFT_168537 [Fomitiporia mediterranea MF3/22]|uniref:uncharacterized protein n=1 Tax=Fomitiporia mediterranea (strain MF3/22) TaxID=694068 RepID=UPI0004409BAD|nr:uncharacterized protein FOMMEDRAFT_168537 [Fomitiporia mediterranea MF3/22]EJD01958.1 hypothetical protein FOMMEDRAFT_168537 [Fomitiporia mediterranea MF3/22]
MQDSNSSQLEDAVLQSQISGYFSLASVVLFYYDYILTFDDEVRFFWRINRKTSGIPWYRINTVAVLFFMNRYIPLAMNATIIVHNLGTLSSSIIIVIVQIIVAMITGIRTYALYERSRAVWKLLAALFVCGVSVGLWSVLGGEAQLQTIDVPAKFGCHAPVSDQEGMRIAAPWIVLMVYDAVIFSLTLWKALEIWKLGSSRLFQILIRDGEQTICIFAQQNDFLPRNMLGSIFFFVMTMANLSNVLVLMLAHPFLKDVCTAFTSVISVIMVSRLILNIQNPKLLEESQTNRYVETVEVGTLVTCFIEDESDYTTSTWTI